nr:MAG TPA: hypothetical protein [Caudoviricetes sp.]
MTRPHLRRGGGASLVWCVYCRKAVGDGCVVMIAWAPIFHSFR